MTALSGCADKAHGITWPTWAQVHWSISCGNCQRLRTLRSSTLLKGLFCAWAVNDASHSPSLPPFPRGSNRLWCCTFNIDSLVALGLLLDAPASVAAGSACSVLLLSCRGLCTLGIFGINGGRLDADDVVCGASWHILLRSTRTDWLRNPVQANLSVAQERQL